MDTVARWVITDADTEAVALGVYREPSYRVALSGAWIAKDGSFDDEPGLRVVRGTFLDLDSSEADDVLLFGSGAAYLAIDLEADDDADATIVAHLAEDLAAADLSDGLRIGLNRYDEAQLRAMLSAG